VSRQEAGLLLKLLVHPEPEVRGAALTVMAASADDARPPPVTAQVELGENAPLDYAKAEISTKIFKKIARHLLHMLEYKCANIYARIAVKQQFCDLAYMQFSRVDEI
jgi:hypothetical protein